MIKKLLYTVFSLLRISLKLHNPLVLAGYLINKPVQLNIKNGLILSTNQLLDAIVVKDTIFDDDYRISKIKKPFKKIIDVGAGLGDFTLMMANKFPKAKVIAFEPNPAQFKLLKKNIEINNVKNIKCHHIAVGTKKTYLLYLSSFNIHSSVIKTDQLKNKIKVKGARLDNYIVGKVDLIKIDCEGAEIDILSSIGPKKMKLIKNFIIEYHNNIIKDEDKKIIAILKKWNYELKIEHNPIVSETGNIFATKK